MPGFEDTKLLRHPTVERAYNEMRKFFLEGEDFAAQAVRAGEIITASAKNPDPDAIAAAVLLDGMIVPYQASSFAATVSPRAAEIVQNMYDFNTDDPSFPSAAEQQIVLAHSIIGLEGVHDKIRRDELYNTVDYENVQRTLAANENCLLKAIEGMTESGMAALGVEKLLITKSALDDMVRRKQAALAFDKSGLPDHPLVREVYEYMKDANIAHHPLGGYTDTNAAIAKVIAETGASSDPEVLCAALLNQYSSLHGERKAAEFSPRIGALWEETSAWAHVDEKPRPTAEGRIIRHAAHIYFMEGMLESLDLPGRDISAYSLEHLEDMKKRLDGDIAEGASPALLPRLRAGSEAANRIMNQPDNIRIRKPGSPPIDPGW